MKSLLENVRMNNADANNLIECRIFVGTEEDLEGILFQSNKTFTKPTKILIVNNVSDKRHRKSQLLLRSFHKIPSPWDIS